MPEVFEQDERMSGEDERVIADERQPLLKPTKSNDPAIMHHLPQHWNLGYRWGIVGLLAFMAFTVYNSLPREDYVLRQADKVT